MRSSRVPEEETIIASPAEQKSSGSKAWIWVLVIVLIVSLAGAGWYFFIRKSAEGGSCTANSRCVNDLKCVNKTCSSGARGSVCSAKADCKTGFCVNGKCTEGKINDTCATYKDCDQGLYCRTGTCVTPPDYSKYFSKVVTSKMKPGLPPGPSNPLTPTTTFSTKDSIEVDFTGVKTTTVGPFYIEIVNSTTGEIGRNTNGQMETKFAGRDGGMGTDLGGIIPGQYDLNVYFNNEMVYSTPITINE